MKCPSCGADIAENVVICHSCGGAGSSLRAMPHPNSRASSKPPGPPRRARPRAAEAEPDRRAEAASTGDAAPPSQTAGDAPPPWRYSLKNMRIIWLNMILLTAAFVALGVWLWMSEETWRPEWISLQVFWGVMLGIPGVIWLYQLCKLIYRTTIKYDLDETRLIHKEGIFVSKTSVIELIRIDDMGATQNLLERFLCGGIGKVRVHSDDPSDPELVLRGLENHDSVFRQIDLVRAQARKKKAFVRA